MPTGYTAGVASGEITTFKEFALQCARAFGACVTMRDDPFDAAIPEEFKPSSYCVDELAEAKEDLARLQAMSVDQQTVSWKEAYANELESHKKYVEKNLQQLQRYQAMLAEVDAWTPPTGEHEGMKVFMIDQLKESIRFDCDYSHPAPQPSSRSEWYQTELKRAKERVEYAEKALQEEIKRVANRNAWIAALRKSLP